VTLSGRAWPRLLRPSWLRWLALGLLVAALWGLAASGSLLWGLWHFGAALEAQAGLLIQLAPDAPPGRLDQVASELAGWEQVESLRRVPRDLALAELREALGGDAELVEELGSDLVPDLIELQLDTRRVGAAELPGLQARLLALPDVAAVSRAGAQPGALQRLGLLVDALRSLVLATALLLALLAAAGVAGPVVLAVRLQGESLRALRLLGASELRLRGHFIVAGLGLGAGAALLCLPLHALSLGLLHALLGAELELLGLPLQGPPLWLALPFVGGAALLGALGAAVGSLASGPRRGAAP